MPNTVYDNSVLETKLTELLNSHLEVGALMTVDDSLTEGAGLTKVINRYTYSGEVEALDAGEANASAGTLTFTPETYTVRRYQQTFRYNDMDAMKDPAIIDAALEGMADVMTNQIRREYFSQLMLIRHRHAYTGNAVTYADIVEALGDIGREVEDGLFILMGPDGRTQIRKDSDFISSRQGEILYSGQFGTLCGVPVLFSRMIPAGMVVITEKSAVKFFVKREAGMEQSRDIETKENTVVYERHGVIALVDDTCSVILGRRAPVLSVSSGTSNGMITLSVTIPNGQNLYYMYDCDAALLSDDLSGWTKWDGSSAIPKGTARRLSLALVDQAGTVKSAGVLSL